MLLPAPEPKSYRPPPGYFYSNVAKHLVKDSVKIMSNGLPIDLAKVQELESTLDDVLARVSSSLASNPIVISYLSSRYSRITAEYIAERQSKLKSPSHFLKPFKHSDITHRSYFMHFFIAGKPITPPTDLLPFDIPKWQAKDVKPYATSHPILAKLLNGTINPANSFVVAAMDLIAQHKADLHNRPFLNDISTLAKVEYPSFNPASPDQKHELLTDILGYTSDKQTDAYNDYEKELKKAMRYGLPPPSEPKNRYSWDRDNIESLLPQARNDDETSLFQALIDYSMGAIIKNNFIKAFYEHTHNNRLYGQYVIGGAKSFRFTSKAP
jgi:hypothetical protein